MPRHAPPSAIVTDVTLEPLVPRAVRRRFDALLAGGATLRPAGAARDDPERLRTTRYAPHALVELFDVTLFLADFRYDDALGFFVAYVHHASSPRALFPRILYKDSSLCWRVASHFVHDADEYWIGKGDVRAEGEILVSSEETTNLPFELQAALDDASRRRPRRRDDDAIQLVLREGPSDRVEPYADFVRPRRAAAARYAIHGDRPIARFTRRGDPTSLRLVRGYEPDLDGGLVEHHATRSEFFGGRLDKARVLSANRRVQYLFFASPTHVWLAHPQALSTDLSSYAVRTVDVHAPDDLSIPGFEYHEDGASQIPDGFAGAPHPLDPHRADAGAWLDALPVVADFRARLLPRLRRRRRT